MPRIASGQVTVTGTAQPLSSSIVDVKGFIIKVLSGSPYIGPAGVTVSTGYALSVGETFEFVYSAKLGEPTFDLRPHEVFVVGSGVVAWVGGGGGQ